MYKRLPVSMAKSTDIFQGEMTDLISMLKYVGVYLDDLLVLTKDSFDNHLVKFEVKLLQVPYDLMQTKVVLHGYI